MNSYRIFYSVDDIRLHQMSEEMSGLVLRLYGSYYAIVTSLVFILLLNSSLPLHTINR